MSDEKGANINGHGTASEKVVAKPGKALKNGSDTGSESTATAVNNLTVPDKKQTEFPPVPFTTLFRFSTPFELTVDALGLLCAIAAGAAQVSFLLFRDPENAHHLVVVVAADDAAVR